MANSPDQTPRPSSMSADSAAAINGEFLDGSLNELVMRGPSLWLDQGFVWIVRAFAFGTFSVLFWMALVILRQAWPAIQHFGFGFLVGKDWDVPNEIFGALPYIYGTLVSSAIALFLAIPIGLSVALVTSEDFLPDWVSSPVAFIVELLASIPSVIVGLWGIFVLIPFLQPIQIFLYDHFRWIPLFSTQPAGPGMLAAGVILAIMILPTIAAISRDVLLSVPKDLRSASMALGGTRWETVFGALLPASFSGIVGASTLALGRALGETMAVTLVIGNSIEISPSLLNSAYTIPAVLANEFAEAGEGLHIGSLMYLAFILFVLTLIVNVAAVLMVQVLGTRRE